MRAGIECKISLAKKLPITLGSTITLPLSTLTFARGTEAYILYNGVFTKQASVNEPATRIIGGRTFIQSTPALATVNKYSEDLKSFYTSISNINIIDNDRLDPLGNQTIDKIAENGIDDTHYIARTITTLTIGVQTVLSGVVYSDERTLFAVYLDTTFPTNLGVAFNIETLSYNSWGGTPPDWVILIPMSDGGVYFALAFTPTLSTNSWQALMCWNGTTYDYQGIDGYGFHAGLINIIKSNIISPYIYAGSSLGTKSKDNGYWAEADVLPWMRNRFYFELYTNMYTSAILAADGGEKHLWSFDATAGAVRCYIDGADSNKMKVDLVGTGNIISSGALTPTLDGRIRCWFTFDNGANSVLKVLGAGVDAEYTGVQLAAADGNLHWAQREDATLQPSLLISLPEKF